METKKIGEIREEFKAAEETMLPSFIEKYRSDERAGVQKLIEQANGRLAKLEAERARIDRLWALTTRASSNWSCRALAPAAP